MKKTNALTLRLDYDADADVLYISKGRPRPGYGDEGPEDVELRYSFDDDTPIGATVVAYKRLNWPKREADLSLIVANHLHIPNEEALFALRSVDKSMFMS